MVLMYRYIYFHLKHNSYFILGLFFGILVSLNYFHYEDEELCISSSAIYSERVLLAEESLTTDGYEPKFLQNKPLQPKKLAKNLQRPRYYSTELGIREKLFIGVLSSKKDIDRAIAINKTLAHIPNKIKFFITLNENKPNLSLSSIIAFIDTRELIKPFRVLKYIYDNYSHDFDYFYLISDRGYIDGRKLLELVNKLSVSKDIFLGTTPEYDSHYCGLDSGMLISNSVLKNVRENLDWCVSNAYSKEIYENIGRCIIHSTGLKCKQHIQDQHLSSYQLQPDWNLKRDLKTLVKNDDFNKAISVYPVENSSDFYSLHLYFSRLHLEKVDKEIESLSKFVSDNSVEGHWPAGVRNDPTMPLPRPPDRFHQPKYTAINASHTFMPDDFKNILPHTFAEKEDFDNIIKVVVSKVENENQNLKYYSFINAYKKIDPSRGVSYIFDMSFQDSLNGQVITKRMEAFKPLGKATILPVPYSTETTRIILILPIWQYEIPAAEVFLKDFETSFGEKKDRLFVLMVLLYSAEAPNKGLIDPFHTIKLLGMELSEKYKNDGLKIAWLSIRFPASSRIINEPGLMSICILDLALKKVSIDSLILIGRPQVEFKPEYLNRVRMNTLQGFQIFSAIGFQCYHPNIVVGPIPSKGSGRFAPWDYSIISFYSKDYISVRKIIQDKYPLVRTDKDIENFLIKSDSNVSSIFEMFVKYSPNLHAFRAVEPGLIFRYDETLFCPQNDVYKNSSISDTEVNNENYLSFGNNIITEKCLDNLSNNNFETVTLGSRSQLAKLIFES